MSSKGGQIVRWVEGGASNLHCVIDDSCRLERVSIKISTGSVKWVCKLSSGVKEANEAGTDWNGRVECVKSG